MPEVPVKVFVRVRPLLEEEQLKSRDVSVTCVSRDQLVVEGDRVFRFDRVFPPSAKQEEVYSEVVSPLVQSFTSGINSTVFAYGQTSSGKTYTLGSNTLASLSTTEDQGLISRAIEEVFGVLREQENENEEGEGGGEGRRNEVRVSYIEVYKEEVRDLLAEGSLESDVIHIREDEAGRTVVLGVIEEVVRDVEEALGWLEAGSIARVTSSTAMNEHSSRSHAIFTLTLDQQREIRQRVEGDDVPVACVRQRLVSKFHFVDLAGSERVSRTANQGERFVESVHINSGLLALGNVISALADPRRRCSHVPYRDSKITRLLKDSLGGSARTVMITCLSPAAANVGETLNALKYARRARNIRNRPVVNQDPQSTIVAAMEREIHSLRAELQRVQQPPSSSTTTITTTVDSSVMAELPSVDPHLRSLREELETCHAHQQQLMAKLHLAYEQVSVVVKRKNLRLAPEPQSALESVLATLEHALTDSSVEGKEGQEDRTPEKRLKRAMKTIELLRSELEKCKRDLQADEEIFAEKMSELNELHARLEQTTTSREEGEKAVVQLRRREKELFIQLEEAAHTVTELKRQLQEATTKLSQTPPPSVTSATTQTQPHSVLTAETTSTHSNHHVRVGGSQLSSAPSHHQGVGHRAVSDGHVHSVSALLCGAVEVQKPEDLTDGACDVALRRLTAVLIHHHATGNGGSSLLAEQEPVPTMLEWEQGAVSEEDREEEEELRESVTESTQAIELVDKRLLQAQQDMRSMSLKIRLKEELIKELIKSSNFVRHMNKSFHERVRSLEEEASSLREQLKQTQRGIRAEERAEDKQTAVVRQFELQKQKLVSTEAKLKMLQQRQREMQQLLRLRGKSEQRIARLEGETERLRNQREMMKRELKEQGGRKTQLEAEVARCKHRLSELETCTDQQRKILKVKTEEVAAAQRKLRQIGGRPVSHTPESMCSHQAWLDAEVEKVLEQKNALDLMHKELAEREEMIGVQEAMLRERAQLERKKLHSRQHISKELNQMSSKITSMDTTITSKEKLRESVDSMFLPHLEKELEELKMERQQLCEKREEMKKSIGKDHILTSEEEMRLIELSEQVEVMESVLQMRGRPLNSSHTSFNLSDHVKNRSDQLHQKLVHLSPPEARSLLVRYVEKVISLRMSEKRQQRELEEVRVQLGKERDQMGVLERSLKRVHLERELKTAKMSKEHEQQVQLLLCQLSDSVTCESNQQPEGTSLEVLPLRAKIKALEKDLYYYKKTSRDLKQQLQRQGTGGSNKQESLRVEKAKKAPSPVEERVTGVEEGLECEHEGEEDDGHAATLHDSLETEDGRSEGKGARQKKLLERDHQRHLKPVRKQ